MNTPKLLILFMVIMAVTFFLLDYLSATAFYMNMESELERALVNAMYASTHLGALRNHEVLITREALEEAIRQVTEQLGTNRIQIQVNTISESPPMVEIQARASRENIIGRFMPELKDTPMYTRTIVIGDLLQEGGDERE